MLLLLFCMPAITTAQQQYELNSGWHFTRWEKKQSIRRILMPGHVLKDALPAIVPGTVLTSLLYNGVISDPFYGTNNERIPDIYNAGRDYYTYWFINDFAEKPVKGRHVWLQLRGVNDGCDVYLNGIKLNKKVQRSMYLRTEYEITDALAKDGNNRLAILVYPPDPVGDPNGGQGGDGMIAHNITNQFTAGWDWIQPVRDRNTGIWDKVIIKKTGAVKVGNTHVITEVPGVRQPEGRQAPALIKVSTELANPSSEVVEGAAEYKLAGKTITVAVAIPPMSTKKIGFPVMQLANPELWWPNGYGSQHLYDLKVRFRDDKRSVSDEESVKVGVRQIDAVWNAKTQSREIWVNGQRIFIKGGNRIVSDAMLRFSAQRYDAEIRYHKLMNLNLIRVWGGGITERPEFYDACDKYGILVLQDFWVSGDCNGRWYDPMKKEDTSMRRQYPDGHRLFIASVADQVKMLRNHPSLALWCGGNEIRPPADILRAMRDTLLPRLDGTRFFFEYSNDDSMSLHSGDGPYTIQPDTVFWTHRSFPFNSEVGSVGIGDLESLERFIPKEHLRAPYYDAAGHKWNVDPVWQYHKYIGYDSSIEAYGHPAGIRQFLLRAQLVNYNQYRSLIEGFSSRMWDWYTGVIIWKTQNPWTAMLGQMYDVYLDPNACMYGLSEGSKPVHVMYNPVNNAVMLVNNTFEDMAGLLVDVVVYDMKGNRQLDLARPASISATSVRAVDSLARIIEQLKRQEGAFLDLQLKNKNGALIDDNFYWLANEDGRYQGLAGMAKAKIVASARKLREGCIEVTIDNPENGPVAFFNRVSLVNIHTGRRILPAFCDNNYISAPPGAHKTVEIDYDEGRDRDLGVSIEGWNVDRQIIELKK